MKEEKVHLEMSKEQSKVILEALDLYSRLATGQFDAIDRVSFLWSKGERGSKEKAIENLQKEYYPDLDIRSSYGIRSPKADENGQIAYDIIQVMRHAISWYEKPEGGITVNFDKPWQVAEEPLCTCKVYQPEKEK